MTKLFDFTNRQRTHSIFNFTSRHINIHFPPPAAAADGGLAPLRTAAVLRSSLHLLLLPHFPVVPKSDAAAAGASDVAAANVGCGVAGDSGAVCACSDGHVAAADDV